MNGNIPAIRNITIPMIVLRLFESMTPEVIAIKPIKANIGGIIWENNKELSTNAL